MFSDNSVLSEISAEIDRINAEMKRTKDGEKLESLRKDMETLKAEYRAEINCLCGN